MSNSSSDMKLSPHLSKELQSIQDDLQAQLKGLEVFLADRDRILYLHTAEQSRELKTRFVGIIQQYLSTTLPDLFRFMDQVDQLTKLYDGPYETFIWNTSSTIRKVELCMKFCKSHEDQHRSVNQKLSGWCHEIADRIQMYRAAGGQRSKGSKVAKFATLTLVVGGLTGGAVVAIVVSPLVAIGTFAACGTGGVFSAALAMFGDQESEICQKACFKLSTMIVCHRELQSSINIVADKLDNCRCWLQSLRDCTEKIADVHRAEGSRREAYRTAQQEIRNIKTACEGIHRGALRLSIMSSQVRAEIRQL
ncbi:hypothetical protein DFQ27_001781 [Actinomortierella ambigua]|uniref:Uncharacterized protein n=1 Tax=Actinomortierella ambigua TaxID=1343610 RepID=A0A9P6U880_9FUNG|nr:hypothetical protein DFQ27_001781 [Actinomortierella ambigua]